MNKASIGVIGGSGLYEIEGAKTIEELDITTPWGNPSDTIHIADVEGFRVAFIPRHGRGHFILPHEVNYRANIAAMKMIGVREIIAFSAVGSLKEEIRPLDFVLPDQIIDRTVSRQSTFFGNGVAAHIPFGHPFCARLHGVITNAAHSMELVMHTDQTLICMEGPAFSTKAESNLYRSWGAGVINMSTLPEAKLAREAEICYAVVCMSTDYDCWHETEEHVTIDMVIKNLTTNAGNAKKLLKLVLESLGRERDCTCPEASKFAIITDDRKRNKGQIGKLKAILPDYFN
ncbi:MAG TPA: S-methyl-5'-thioadenosine phosphorylase [Spirochaetota bacterium]|nr:S-methyl-5'-thioadenosine phosphorylase [Spirochaetota bacterium]HOD13223.1 S-methyl-5'-thioadenosine phosphorylase [Spirochaetota bacterium]HPG48969.1 S-methyl-5'-thioadenosine phosphorylase [Spirochaetota bacterium]HPN10478.1 S-methyl-5'-thioadenosine phosphorylase [Spirochaetota bacterium]HQL82581.1 S-methyl-5'-thioadenosine phosphorylase [Spirochaetota bacterium]